MKRLFTLVIALTAAAFGMWADSQTELNRQLKAYNSQMAAHQYLPAARSAAAAAAICADAKNYDGAFRLLANNDKTLAERHISPDSLPAVFYTTERARFLIYRNLSNNSDAGRSLAKMAGYAKKAGNKELTSDMLFNEAQYC